MKNVKNKLWLIFAMIALVGFAAVSCDNGTINPGTNTGGKTSNGDGDGGGGGNRFLKVTVNAFTVQGKTPESISMAVYADDALTQILMYDYFTDNVWINEIPDVPSNNTVYAVIVAGGGLGAEAGFAPRKFTLDLGEKAAGESLESPKELSVNFENVGSKTVNVSYSFVINGATPAHSGIEYMKPVVGFFFELPGLGGANDLGEVKGYYTASGVAMTVPDVDTLLFPIYFSVFAYAEGALNPTLKVFTTGGPDYTSNTWDLGNLGDIVQRISGTVNLASFDLDQDSTSVSIFTADDDYLGNGDVISGNFSFLIISQNTAKAGYAMVIGSKNSVETIRYSTAFTIPAATDPNQSLGALTYDSNRKHPAVTFNLNGGNIGGNTDPVVMIMASNFQIDPTMFPEAVRVVHTLEGWNTKADGSGTPYFGQETKTDITVYAQWEFTPITVNFNVNGGMWRDGTNTAVTAETNTSGLISPLPAAPIRNGYSFDGWNTSSGGTGTDLTASTPVTTAMATVYAKWTADASKTTATVTFNGNGGTWNGAATKATYTLTGETALMAETPTSAKLGTSAEPPSGATLSATLSEGLYAGAGICTFTGWNTAANGSGTAFTASTVVSGNITVYAQWQEPAQWSAYKYTSLPTYYATFFENAMSYAKSNNGNYILVLGSDVTVSSEVYIFNESSVMLVGAGSRRTIRMTGNDNLFQLRANAKLILDYNITLQGHGSNNSALVLLENASGGKGQLVMNEGAVITGNTNSNSSYYLGGGVMVEGGTFTMNGGTISNNNVNCTNNIANGGGVYVESGTFTMNGGTISGNKALSQSTGNGASYQTDGGGVYIRSGTFTMSGGTISGNEVSGTYSLNGNSRTSGEGGGVSVGSGGTFTMSGGTISGNTANSGGGAHVQGGTLTMSGGTISGNTANGSGGGVYVQSGTFRLITGTIYGNENTIAENLRNTATGSGASLNISGTATYGTSASGGTSGGSLASSSNTIKVVNGEMQ